MRPVFSIALAAAGLVGGGLLLTFERPPVDIVQRGYRGLAMEQNYHPKTLAKLAAANQVPFVFPAAQANGPTAGATYKNVQVLKDLSVGQFTRLMAAITTWVAPQQGCTYCHVDANNLSSDNIYTKVVARRMLQMTQHINADWTNHVAATGVTCYTCHRGNPVPAGVWYNDTGTLDHRGIGRGRTPSGQNRVALNAAFSSLPYDPLTPFLEAVERDPGAADDGAAEWQRDQHQADRVDLRADDELLPGAGGELHVLPQHAVVLCLGCQHPAARDGVVWHSDGAGPEQQLPQAVAAGVPGGAAWAGRRWSEAGMRDLPPGRLQAAVRGQHRQWLSGTEDRGEAVGLRHD